MHYRSLVCSIAVTSLIIFAVSRETRPQSGRGRPKVPVPSQPGPPQPAVNIPESTVVVKQEQAANASRFVLRNGMTVLLSEQHTYPLAVVGAYFKTGRLNEADYNVGRVLQRVLIAGDVQSAPFKNARAIRALGGHLSVEAGRDHAYFCSLLSSKNVNEALAAQADMLLHPSLTADSAMRAALAVEAEDARRCEDPAEYSSDRMNALSFSSSDSAAGAGIDNRTGITQDRLLEFYKNHYRPDEFILSIVGDIPTFETLVQIERLYGGFGAAEPNAETGEKPAAGSSAGATPAGAEAAASRPTEQKQTDTAPPRDSQGESPRLLYGETRGKIRQSIVTVGYRVAGLKSDDWPALAVLAALLGQGRGSALELTLFFNQGVVNHAICDYCAGLDAGLVSIQLWLPPAAIDKAEASLFKEIDRIIKAQPDPAELARAKAVAEIRFDQKVEGLVGTALMMAEQGAASESISTAATLVGRIRSVRPEDVQFVAAKYLALSNASIHEYEPLTAPGRTFDSASFARTVLSWAPGLAQSASANLIAKRPASPGPKISEKERAAQNQAEAEAENVQPLPVKDFSTLNGPKVFVREDHTRPEVTIAILFQGGRISETEVNTGITDLMLRVLLYGTARVTREHAAMALDKFGADVRLINESDYFGFALTCLSSNAGEALRLLRDLIEAAAFRDPDIERARQEQLGLIWAARDSERERSYGLMLEATFPGHPYGLGPHGVQASIEKLKSDDLRNWYSKAIKSQFPLAVIVGDTDGSALVSEGIAGEFKRRDLTEAIKARIPARPSNVEKSEQGSCPVTIQYLGFPGPRSESNDLAALDLIEQSLNGVAGGFEEDLVYKQGVGWAIWLGYRAMATGGLVYAGIESAPEDRQRARAATVSRLQQISGSGLSGNDLQEARGLAATFALRAMAGQQQRALAYAEALYSKRDASFVDVFVDALDKVSAADVKRAASAYLKPGAFSVGIIQGPASPKQGAPPTQ